MTQPNLLELAKQGDAEAIARLMNLTLEPRGVTASAKLDDGCLHVFLSSLRTLNQQTLVSFVQKGLTSLDVKSIHTVKVHGQKEGQVLPIWVAEFATQPDPSSTQTQPLPSAESPYGTQPGDRQPVWHDSFIAFRPYLDHARAIAERTMPQLRDRVQHSTRSIRIRSHRMASHLRLSKDFLRPHRPYSHSLAKLAIVTLPAAFLLGGLVAVIDSYRSAARQSGTASTSQNRSDNSQMSIKSEVELEILSQQSQAKKYLAKMNQAQQTFYIHNGRFATNLEELERSTETISLTSDKQNYVYRLSQSNDSQAQLTAVPKAGGLKSFSGVVFLSLAEDGSESTATLICESTQPSKSPPTIAQTTDTPLKCPANATKVR